jgi:DNA-binding XRE family transcriptional regulator
MPRIAELKPDYMAKDIGIVISGLMKRKKITPKQMGERLGISRQAMNYKIDNNAFSYRDIIVIFHELELTSEDILRYVQYR